MEITKILQTPDLVNNTQISKESSLNKMGFDDFMQDMINEVNQIQIDANNNVESMIKGEEISMHEVMLSVQEAQMSTQLLIEVRNKIYDVYQEMNKVQI